MRSVRLSDLFEGVVEASDASTGRLLASIEVGGGMLGFAGGGILSEVVELASGETGIQLWTYSLQR